MEVSCKSHDIVFFFFSQSIGNLVSSTFDSLHLLQKDAIEKALIFSPAKLRLTYMAYTQPEKQLCDSSSQHLKSLWIFWVIKDLKSYCRNRSPFCVLLNFPNLPFENHKNDLFYITNIWGSLPGREFSIWSGVLAC